MTKLIVQCDEEDWVLGPKLAKAFLRDYPDRPTGFHSFVVYMLEDKSYVVYKTKTAIVVRSS